MSSKGTYHSLVEKFERTKRELVEAESTIKRLTGRDPDEISNGVAGTSKYKPSSSAAGSGRSYSERRRPYTPGKRAREEESSDYESPDDDDLPSKRHSLQSTVVAKRNETRSRRATIAEQNVNSKIKARNRRMFGALIGTLEKFQHEEKKRQHKESMRAEIEQKVEAATEEERERIKREKELLFVSRREKQFQLRCLEKKIERAESHEAFERNQKKMVNFIKTRTKPCIFFCPASHTAATKKCLEESRRKIQETIEKRRELLLTDLCEIDEWYSKDILPQSKENVFPKADTESRDVHESETDSVQIVDDEIVQDEDDSTNDKTLGSLADQDFEPIYD